MLRTSIEELGSQTALYGPNFSGRTELLRSFTGLGSASAERPPGDCAYIGPDVYNYISGLAGTVQEELELQAASPTALRAIVGLIEALNLTHLLDRNPFTLSGGEQALVAIAAAAGLEPSRLALDCTLEQLDTTFRGAVIRHMATTLSTTATLIADNRLEEYDHNWSRMQMDVDPKGPLSSLALGEVHPPLVSNPAPLRIENITFQYPGGPPILSGVSLTLAPGTPYCLNGASGSGKSTFAKVLAGVLRPTGGAIWSANVQVNPWRTPGRLVGYHFQAADTQLFATTVQEELHLSARQNTQGLFRASDLAAAFGLRTLLSTHPLDLPFVVRKRIALAATFAMPVPWLILDEPTLGQDEHSIEAIAALINLATSFGAGCIVITHSTRFPKLLHRAHPLHLAHGHIWMAQSNPTVDSDVS